MPNPWANAMAIATSRAIRSKCHKDARGLTRVKSSRPTTHRSSTKHGAPLATWCNA
eukprot:CAMPEP_0198349298 /NCGR_PEP_ID=MMETSP1450-20131203/93455_1 /TAXON_ID=753684 ORGANISM="Madagascaria erythrocladiodes, Strain CCMP3234" /NCGR_SAMPLE_ID=MMETSP1450 /ASSEMBLY_ACC=CAM_ASM_001115 /LENGTH=55 /DNA_ID=CAMNT_0044054971 /DNA_START=130 /DNA_END=293 /DNA_ORIENTATION=+